MLVERVRQEAPGLWGERDAGLEETLQRSLGDHVARVVRGLRNGRELPADLTPSAVAEVQAAARARVAVEDLLHARRVAHGVVWEALMEEVHRLELDARVQLDLMKMASRYLFGYVDRVLPLLRAAYEQERFALARGRGRRREQLVDDLLAGLPVDAADLGYDLRRRHLCAIAWGVAPEVAVQALAAHVKGRELLLASGADRSVRAWIVVSHEGWDGAVRLPAGCACAVGEPADGVEGFRASHRQAQSAHRIGLRRGADAVTRYRDVAVEALAAADEAAARDFVAFWMGPLAAPGDPRMDVLRRTLSAYFAAGQNALAAAARLGVNDRTVAYRLRTIEERLLGAPISTRRDELAVALRLHALAGAATVR